MKPENRRGTSGALRVAALAGFACLAAEPRIHAELPRLIADVATVGAGAGSGPSGFVGLGSVAVFAARNDTGAWRIARSDGSHDGTYFLDTAPEADEERVLGRVGDVAIFRSARVGGATEVWATDGTFEGTRRLLAIPYQGYEEPEALVAGDRAWIVENDVDDFGYAMRSRRIFETDGSPTGTRVYLELEAADDALAVLLGFVDGRLVFYTGGYPTVRVWSSQGGTSGQLLLAELEWQPRRSRVVSGGGRLLLPTDEDDLLSTDGTSAGTLRFPAAQFGFVEYLFGFHEGRFYFASNGASFDQVWSTSGDPADVVPESDLPAGTYIVPFATSFARVGARLYFVANSRANGTRLYAAENGHARKLARLDLHCGPMGCAIPWVSSVGERALFRGDGEAGAEPWITDGTVVGTGPLADLNPGEESSWPSYPTPVDGSLLFFARDAATGGAFYATDGTPQGTVTIARSNGSFAGRADHQSRLAFAGGGSAPNLFSPPEPESPIDLAQIGEMFLFGACDAGHACEPWRGELAAGSGRLVRDLRREPPGTWFSEGAVLGDSLVQALPGDILITDGRSSPRLVTTGGSYVGLRATATRVLALGESEAVLGIDPVAATVEELLPAVGTSAWVVGIDGERAAFALGAGLPSPLWRTDGSRAGTEFLGEVPAPHEGYTSTMPIAILPAGEAWIVAVSSWWGSGDDPGALYAWTPESQGVTRISEWIQGLLPLGVAGDRAYFTALASGFDTVEAILETDGTTSGTREIVRFASRGHTFSSQPLGEGLLVAGHFGNQLRLWTISGDPASIEAIGSFDLSSSTELVPDGRDGFLFVARDPQGGDAIWTTRGTPESTHVVAPLLDGVLPVTAWSWVSDGENVYVRGYRSAEEELVAVVWSAPLEGPRGGVVKRFAEPEEEWTDRTLAAFPGGVAFVAWDATHGAELWTSAGTTETTRRVSDLRPGALSSNPQGLRAVDDRVFFSADDGLHGREPWVWDTSALEVCRARDTALCLGGRRFRAEAFWEDFAGGFGDATAVSLSSDSGAFWFFDPDNVEMIAKVLDGRETNGHFWVFDAALSNLRFALTVSDEETGAVRRYENATGHYASFGDVRAFDAGGDAVAAPVAAVAPLSGKLASTLALGASDASGSCTPTPTRLCLREGRFAVEASWRDFAGRTGTGAAAPWSAEAGTFWFFDDANIELIVKLLDGRGINGRFWFYSGALSNVEYTITVSDTLTGAIRRYINPAGSFASFGDVDAF
jgi:ELWxxDGT repeat protein